MNKTQTRKLVKISEHFQDLHEQLDAIRADMEEKMERMNDESERYATAQDEVDQLSTVQDYIDSARADLDELI